MENPTAAVQATTTEDPVVLLPPPPATSEPAEGSDPELAKDIPSVVIPADDTSETVPEEDESTVEEVFTTGGAADDTNEPQEAITTTTGEEATAAAGLLQQLLTRMSDNKNNEEESQLLKAAKAGLDQLDMRYEVHPPREGMASTDRIISFGLRCDDCNAKCVLVCRQSEDKFSFFMTLPTTVPQDKRDTVAIYLTRVNYGLSIGNFEMDFSDGEIRYKVSAHLPGSQLSPEMVKHTIGVSVSMVDRFFPGLMMVTYCGKNPQEAHDECTRNKDEETQQAQ